MTRLEHGMTMALPAASIADDGPMILVAFAASHNGIRGQPGSGDA